MESIFSEKFLKFINTNPNLNIVDFLKKIFNETYFTREDTYDLFSFITKYLNSLEALNEYIFKIEKYSKKNIKDVSNLKKFDFFFSIIKNINFYNKIGKDHLELKSLTENINTSIEIKSENEIQELQKLKKIKQREYEEYIFNYYSLILENVRKNNPDKYDDVVEELNCAFENDLIGKYTSDLYEKSCIFLTTTLENFYQKINSLQEDGLKSLHSDLKYKPLVIINYLFDSVGCESFFKKNDELENVAENMGMSLNNVEKKAYKLNESMDS